MRRMPPPPLTVVDVQFLLQQFAGTELQESLSAFGATLREGIRSDLQSALADKGLAHTPAGRRASRGSRRASWGKGAGAAGKAFDFLELHVPTHSQQGGAEGAAAADAPGAGGEGPPPDDDGVGPPAEPFRKWELAKTQMKKLRALVPTQTPDIARELTDVGYFTSATPTPHDPRRQKRESIAHKLMLDSSGTGNGLEMERLSSDMLRSTAVDYSRLPHQHVMRLVRSNPFEYVVIFVICLNALFIGTETNMMALAKSADESRSTLFMVMEAAFMVFFTVELGLRLFAFRWWFFRRKTPVGRDNQNFFWNVLDFTLVALQLLDCFLRSVRDVERSIRSETSILRVLRILRIARLLRVGKVLRAFRTLRTIVQSIRHSASLFIWALFSLLLLYYLFAVYITEVVMDDLHAEKPDAELSAAFGSVKRSMASLAMGSTGGVDWGELYHPLSRVSTLFAAIPIYVFLMFLAIVTMNVFTGVIFDSVQKKDRQDNESELLASAFEVFLKTDVEGMGTITKEDFRKKVKDDEVKRFFATIDLDIQQAEILFDLLDMSNDGSLSCSEFLRGCMHLQGNSKAVDLLILSREVTQLFDGIANLNKQNEEAAAAHRAFLMDLTVENQRLLKSLLPLRGDLPHSSWS